MRKVILGLALIVMGATSLRAQTIDSVGVKVRNNTPENVTFSFPTGSNDNVDAIQMGCSGGPTNANWVFVYEVQPSGFITTYPFNTTVNCIVQFNYDSRGFPVSATVSLTNQITIQTSDHTVTIDDANWTAVYKSSRSGYYWLASGGSAQITVQ